MRIWHIWRQHTVWNLGKTNPGTMRNPLFNLPFWNETNLHVQKEIHLQRVRPFSMGAFSKTSKKTVLRGVFLLIPLAQLGLRKGDSEEVFSTMLIIAMLASIIFYKSLSKHSTSPNRVFRKTKTRWKTLLGCLQVKTGVSVNGHRLISIVRLSLGSNNQTPKNPWVLQMCFLLRRNTFLKF